MRNFYFILFFILLATNFLIFQAILAPRTLEVTVLEVGKGNATLVRTPNRKTILIDTGPDASILRALGTALPPWQRTIDAIVLTSEKTGDGGLSDVTNRYRIPTPLRFGTITTPYGARLALDAVYIDILAPGIFTIFYGATSLSISSTTSKGIYISDGKTIK
jgi:hypothetical protein